MEISFTQLRVYLECPWKYKLMFVDRLRAPATPAGALGSAIHKALERYFRKGPFEEERLLELFDEAWRASCRLAPEACAEWARKGRRILKSFHKRDSARRTEIVGLEKEFSYPLGEHMVRGMIDRVDLHPDGRHEIIDYKTQMDAQSEAEVSDSLQLRFYGLGVRETYAMEPALLTMDYLAADKAVSVPYDASREDELKERIASAADRIEAGDFKPDTSFCPRCEFRLTCAHSTARG